MKAGRSGCADGSWVGRWEYPVFAMVVRGEPGSVKTAVVYDQLRRAYRTMPTDEVKKPAVETYQLDIASEERVLTCANDGSVMKPYACFNPYGPGGQAVDKAERNVADNRTAVAFAFSRATFRLPPHRRGGGR